MNGVEPADWDEADGEAALAWLVRIQSDAATPEDWAALTVWLGASAAHLAAFEAIEALSAEIDDLAPDILSSLSRPSAEILPFPRRPVARPPPRRSGVRAAIAACAVGLALVAGLGVWQTSRGDLQEYRTASGETRAIVLADGSRVRLNAASTLRVRLGWFNRRAQLGDGEATFDVAKNSHRPFEIAVSDQRVRVVGTQFNIRNYDGVIDVTVRRGVVAVYQPGVGQTPVARLTAGWSLEHAVGERESVSRRVDPDDAFAWTQGRLICDGQPLFRIVAYLNRRYAVPLRVSPAAATKRFSGVLELGDEDDVVRHIAAYVSLHVDRSDGEIRLD